METILSIVGRPGLFKLVNKGKNTFIVEALDETRRRMPVFSTNRVTSLADVAMFTDGEDVPLWQVLEKVAVKEDKKVASVNYRKATSTELRDYFSDVLPDYDRDRVHDNDIKKLLQWYDILVKAGITDFREVLAPTEGDNVSDRA